MLRRRMRSERGAAAVEFALVVPILIVLVFGIAEFGRAFFIQSTISGAAREGVRRIALADSSDPTGTAAATAALGGITATLNPGAACPDPSVDPSPNTTFTITYQFTSVTGLFGSSITLTGKGVMRCNG